MVSTKKANAAVRSERSLEVLEKYILLLYFSTNSDCVEANFLAFIAIIQEFSVTDYSLVKQNFKKERKYLLISQ